MAITIKTTVSSSTKTSLIKFMDKIDRVEFTKHVIDYKVTNGGKGKNIYHFYTGEKEVYSCGLTQLKNDIAEINDSKKDTKNIEKVLSKANLI